MVLTYGAVGYSGAHRVKATSLHRQDEPPRHNKEREEMNEDDYKARFKTQMLSHAKRFDDGSSVAEYADEIWKTYYEDVTDGDYDPEGDADADVSYWGE